jgi:hypothetical protein
MGIVGTIIVRLYALIVLLVVLWAGYAAVAYLIQFVFRPARVPDRFVEHRDALNVEKLSAAKAGAAVLASKWGPIGHYHELERWFQPDPHNGCTTSGCHNSLPHSRSKETRSFANFHAMFLSCTMCHDATARGPVKAMWVGTESGQPQGPPALLALLSLLEVDRDKIDKTPVAVHGDIVRLLGEILAVIGDDPVLNYLRVQIDTSEPGSPVWRQAVGQLTAELPNHARGEYGAKIMTAATSAELEQRRGELRQKAQEYFASSPEQHRVIQKTIHENVLPKPEACMSCHDPAAGRLDFSTLGYPPGRVSVLKSQPIARLIQQIREGRPFYLPNVEGGDVR